MFFGIVKLHDLSHPEVDLYIAIEGVIVDVEGQLELSFFLDVGRLKQSQRIGVQLPPDCNDRGGCRSTTNHQTVYCSSVDTLAYLKCGTVNQITSCRLQQRPQLCRDHQVCDTHHLPSG